MLNLKFAETHNLVAFLEKPKESDGFEGIIDFLNASSIRYALTVNPTIYTSCIKQFWATTKAKTVNREVHIQALVDRKKVIVTGTSVRGALQLKDAEGTECLPNATIFAKLERLGAKTTAWNEFSSTMASAIICLATNQKFNFSKYIFDNMPQKKQPRRKQRKDTEVPQPSGSTEPITDKAANEEHAKDKGKEKMVEPEKPLKKKDQILVDEEIAQRLQEELQAELEEEERMSRQKEEEDNLISWDNTQAMMKVDYELAQRLQAEEQGELTIEERSKLFVELMDKRKKHFTKLRAEEIKRKPPTKAQKRNQMYSFVPMDTEVVEGSKSRQKEVRREQRRSLI
ncbi:hypothetical protein Tco_0779956 [Tanacetum coccineum]